MKTYKTAGEINRDIIRNKANVWQLIQTMILCFFIVLLLAISIGSSIRTSSKIKALEQTISQCKAKPACNRVMK
jgi:hypothetical protein